MVSCADGSTIGTAVSDYHSGDQGVLTHPSDPHLARQNPADYIGSLGHAITTALAQAAASPGFSRDRVIGIGTDTTGSTPLPIDRKARPLALDPRWEGHLAAQAWLWKDHTGSEEAAAITAMAKQHAPHYLAPIGGTYSSEWWWSKIWKCLKVAPDVFDAAASWVELADFVPAVLAGVSDSRDIVRCVCAAGHKAMYSEAWGGLPAKAFLARLDPKLAELRDRLYDNALPPGIPAGNLCREWANALGLPEGIVIAMGGFDAHYGAVGSGIEVGTLVKIIGTSTCDCAIAQIGESGSPLHDPGHLRHRQRLDRAGLSWASRRGSRRSATSSTGGSKVSARAATGCTPRCPRGGVDQSRARSGLLALDWNNGNRTILVDPELTGLILGQTLHTTRAEIYRALIEATAFGARTIIERMREYGVPIDRVVCCGGIAEKNDVFMQIYADVIGQPMLIAGSSQAPALGAAISAAVTAGEHPSWTAAQQAMTSVNDRRFEPDPKAHAVYNELHAIYRELHDEFGGVRNADLGSVMKQLLAIRARVMV